MSIRVSEPSIELRRGKWFARARVYQGDAKPRQVSKVLAKATDKQVEAYDEKKRVPVGVVQAAAEWTDALREAGDPEPVVKPETVHKVVVDHIKARQEAGTASLRTVSGYNALLSTKIDPALGPIPVNDLGVDTLQEWVNGLSRTHAQNTVHKAVVLLKSALRRAVGRGLIDRNPLEDDFLELPSQKKADPNALDWPSIRTVAKIIEDDERGDPFIMAVCVALYTGMREAEICGLRWSDVDMDARTIKVRRQVASIKSDELDAEIERLGESAGGVIERVPSRTHLYIKKPKTEGSSRTVTFPSSMVAVLERRRGQQKAEAEEGAWDFTLDYYLTGAPDGAPMSPNTVSHRWEDLVRGLGLMGTQGRPPAFHDLRHTYATVGLASGIDVKTVSNQLGHADAAMTLNIYAAVDQDAAYRAAETMDRAIRGLEKEGSDYE